MCCVLTDWLIKVGSHKPQTYGNWSKTTAQQCTTLSRKGPVNILKTKAVFFFNSLRSLWAIYENAPIDLINLQKRTLQITMLLGHAHTTHNAVKYLVTLFRAKSDRSKRSDRRKRMPSILIGLVWAVKKDGKFLLRLIRVIWSGKRTQPNTQTG